MAQIFVFKVARDFAALSENKKSAVQKGGLSIDVSDFFKKQ
jgi:hypothetical protein